MKRKIKIKNAELVNLLGGSAGSFPKYTTQIINLANQNAQGTRAKVVGQMSELIQEFPGKTLDEWIAWYSLKHPDSIDRATELTYAALQNLAEAIQLVDKPMVREWVKDLVHQKTFAGLKFQEAILKRIAELLDTSYRLSTPEEESKGIDGFIGDKPVSIKAATYKSKTTTAQEKLQGAMIYYDKKKDGLSVEFDL